jgi:hypothetical protein
MQIKIEITKTTTKRLLLVGIVLSVVLTVTFVRAVPVTFTANQVLTAAQLNQNFSDLETRMKAVEAATHPASAFRAMLTTAQTIPTSLRTTVIFDKVEFDSGGEYNMTTGGFTAGQAGVYVFTCTVEFVASLTTDWYVTIKRNGGDLIGAEFTTPGAEGASPQATVVTKLAANDTMTCAAYQASGGPLALVTSSDNSRGSFSGARLY